MRINLNEQRASALESLLADRKEDALANIHQLKLTGREEYEKQKEVIESETVEKMVLVLVDGFLAAQKKKSLAVEHNDAIKNELKAYRKDLSGEDQDASEE